MKFKFCQVGMGADDTQFASAFPSTKEALVKELGQQNLVNAIVQNLGVDPKDKSSFKKGIRLRVKFMPVKFTHV